MSTPAAALARLRALAEFGGLDSLCRRFGVRVLSVFGSTARAEPDPRDLDVAVLLEPGPPPNYGDLISALRDAAGIDIDFVVLNSVGPLLRERALIGSVVLYESVPGAWINAATAAATERMDTDWLRRLQLDVLAGR
jgi:predicted nucleotidyltransferase